MVLLRAFVRFFTSLFGMSNAEDLAARKRRK
jgi:hypothetical protein